MNTFRLLLVTALALPTPALAQQPTRAISPLKQLDFYVGHWSSRGQTRNGPTDRFTTVRTSESCNWVIGGHAVECRERVTTSSGSSDGIYLLTYDSAAKQFTVYGLDDTGMELSGVGNVEPGTGKWLWTLEMTNGGQTSRWRYEFAPINRARRNMTLLLQDADGKWTTMTNTVYTRDK